MSSLKEIKDRINSVNGTLKITSAMKMVASSKLRKAQAAIGNLLPYQRQMHHILADLLQHEASAGEAFAGKRPLKKVAIVAFASNTSLCGAFNSNVIRHFAGIVEKYRAGGLGTDDILVFAVGRKMADAARKMGFESRGDFSHLADKPSYDEAAALARQLMSMFENKEVDRIELVYTHCKSASSQIPVNETYLPVSLESSLHEHDHDNETRLNADFIIEPDAASVLETLLPQVLLLKIYAVLLDASAAEHSARMLAMQLATDNGNQLLDEIHLQYNKQRQQEITNELQDIIGGSMS